MEDVLHGLIWNSCFVYIDDVLVCSQTFEVHLQHLEQVFQHLCVANLKRKCSFLRSEVSYLGHVVTRDGNLPGLSKTEKIKEYPIPADFSKYGSFWG